MKVFHTEGKPSPHSSRYRAGVTRENVFIKRKACSPPRRVDLRGRASWAPSGGCLTVKGPSQALEAPTSLEATSRQRRERGSPCLTPPAGPPAAHGSLPEPKATVKPAPIPDCALHKYLHSSSRGLQQTQHGGAALPNTLQTPEEARSGPHPRWSAGGPPGPQGGVGTRSPPRRPGHPAPAPE